VLQQQVRPQVRRRCESAAHWRHDTCSLVVSVLFKLLIALKAKVRAALATTLPVIVAPHNDTHIFRLGEMHNRRPCGSITGRTIELNLAVTD
jgi:hypothetical protein